MFPQLRPLLNLTFAFLIAISSSLRADDWPQWLGPQRDGVWREDGILEKFPRGGPKVRWRVNIGGGYTGPAVANGRVYVMDRKLAQGAANPANAFSRGSIAGVERILCLDENDGKILWQHEYDCPYTVSYAAGPRATPLVAGGKVYTLGAEGHLHCLNTENGKVIWSRDFKKDYGIPTPLWGFAGHPLLDGNKLICLVGGDGSTAVTFDKETGKELWRALKAKEPGYCPPTIFEAGGKRQLIIWHPESINSLDPETGRVYWSEPFGIRSALTVSTPRQSGDMLFFTSFYNGSMAFRWNAERPSLIWKSAKASEKDTDALHSIMSTPFIEDGHVYGVCSYGQLRCLKANTGERLWETLSATTPDGKEARWANAFLVKHTGRFFLFNEKGDLIIAKLKPTGYEEISRAHLLEPTNRDPGRDVVWSHPAFANKRIYVRNDQEIICADLTRGQ